MVDDSPADRKLCLILLEENYGSGLEFVQAIDGSQGLDLCRSTPPGLRPAGLQASRHDGSQAPRPAHQRDACRFPRLCDCDAATGLASEQTVA